MLYPLSYECNEGCDGRVLDVRTAVVRRPMRVDLQIIT